MPSMHPHRIVPVAIAAIAIVVAACGGGNPASGAPSPEPSIAATESVAPAEPQRIEVTLSDTFRIEPATMEVKVGSPVTFVVTNSGVLPHEFYLGDEAAQEDHEAEMASGGMGHDEPEGIALEPGETKELTYTFESAGDSIAGCHVAGHYAAGMRASITIVP